MYVIVQNQYGKFRILEIVYSSREKAENARKEIFIQNGGQKSGRYTVYKLGEWIKLESA